MIKLFEFFQNKYSKIKLFHTVPLILNLIILNRKFKREQMATIVYFLEKIFLYFPKKMTIFDVCLLQSISAIS